MSNHILASRCLLLVEMYIEIKFKDSERKHHLTPGLKEKSKTFAHTQDIPNHILGH